MPDHYHCGMVDLELAKKLKSKLDPKKNCICSVQKGWVCLNPLGERVYSGWPEHSLGCEMYIEKSATDPQGDLEI
jgi:hypothetical protein